jgi:hypothetical protein
LKGPATDATDAPQPEGFIVQLCGENDGEVFFCFSILMEHKWSESGRGKPKYSEKNPIPVPLFPPQIPHGPTKDRTRAGD